MMAPAEFNVFSAWCRAHDLRWLATQGDDGVEEVQLEAEDRSAPWQRTRLVRRDGSYHLTDESGNALASASGLQPVLDALDGGVAERLESPRPGRYISGACLV